MITQDREVDGQSPAEHLRLVTELSCFVARVSENDLSAAITRILDEVRGIVGLPPGSVLLFDYLADEVHGIGEGGGPTAWPAGTKVSGASKPDTSERGLPVGENQDFLRPVLDGENISTFPVIAGSEKLGELCLVWADGQAVTLSQKQEAVVAALASLAAMAFERRMRQRHFVRLREWLSAFSSVFAASRVPRSERDVDFLLQEIANNALSISRADLVVLYEYFEEREDVRLPPTLAGSVREAAVLRGRGVAIEHRHSAVFRLLDDMQSPFYAEQAARDWAKAGLTDSDSGEGSFFAREGVVSSAGIPLRIDSERVGVLFVNYRQPQSFPHEFCEHLEMFANQAALAIGNARFFLRSERYARELEALNRIGRELGSAVTRDIEQIGRLIDEQTVQVIPTENFFLCLYDADRGRFTLPYIRDQHDKREDLEPRLHQGLTGHVCRTGKPFLGTPESKQVLFTQGAAQPVGHPAAIWLGAPLIVRDKAIGALVVQDYEDEAKFGQGHLNLLQAIASQAAIAIDNYRLLRETKLRLEELSALLELSQAFGTRRLTTNQLLASILDHLCRLAGGDGSLLLLLDRPSASLKVEAASGGLHSFVGKKFGLHQGLSGKVARTGQPGFHNEYANWPERILDFDPPPKRVCAVPLIWQGETIGVLTLSSDSDAGSFSEREVEILQRLAGPAAIAIGNARDNSFRTALIHAGPNAIVAVDQEGRINEFNAEAARLFKYTGDTAQGKSDDLKGTTVTKLYWGGMDDARKVQNLLKQHGKIKEHEVFGRSKNNDKIPLSLAAALLKDDSGEVMGSVGVLEDLRLQSLRGRTQLLVEVLPEISDSEDLEQIIGNVLESAVTLLYADAGCLFLVGGDSFEVRPWRPLEEDQMRVLRREDVRERLIELGKTYPRSIVFLPEDETIRELHLLADARSSVLVPIGTETRLLAFLLIESRQVGHFSADQKLLEVLASQAAVSINRVQLLRYREQTQRDLLVSSNAIVVGQLATSFVHEAKNSLNGMQLALQILHDDLQRWPDSKEGKNYLERLEAIQSEVARFDDLSRRLQRFTQMGLRPEKSEVYLNDVVNRTLELLGSALRSKGMKFETRLDPSLDPPMKGVGNPVLIDEQQIQQVLMNLILNAMDASRERQPLLVETKAHAEQVEMRVTDHGSGIPREVRAKLFQPFSTTKPGGVGLGLFLSRILVEDNHGGTIEFASGGSGRGSTFSVRLPWAI